MDKFIKRPLDHWIPALEAIAHEASIADSSFRRFYHSQVFQAGDLVIKLRPPRNRRSVIREEHVLGSLPDLPVETPSVVASGDMDEWRWLVTTRVHGRELSEWRLPGLWGELSNEDRLPIVEGLAKVASVLHDHPTSDLDSELLNASRRKSGPSIESIVEEYAQSSQVPQVLCSDLAGFLESEAQSDRHAVLLHNDFRGGNLAVDLQGSRYRLSAIFDFEDAGIGPAEADLIGVLIGFFEAQSTLVDRFMNTYASNRGLDVKRLQCGLLSRLLRRESLDDVSSRVRLGDFRTWEDVGAHLFPCMQED